MIWRNINTNKTVTHEVGCFLNRLPAFYKDKANKKTTAYSHVHTLVNFRIANCPKKHAFGLQEETHTGTGRTRKLYIERPQWSRRVKP